MTHLTRENLNTNHPNFFPRLATFVACGLALLAAGCASSKNKEKPAHERGWIGGEYRVVHAFPTNLTPRPKTGMLLVAVSTNAPVYTAGLRAGDVIVQLDHQPIRHLPDFRKKIDALKPGTLLPVTAWHDGQTLESKVSVGRETFRYNGMIAIGLPGFSDAWHLWPTHENPEFSLLVLGFEYSSGKRAELDSVKNTYLRNCDPKNHLEASNDDVRYWLAIMQLSKNETILKQEQAAK